MNAMSARREEGIKAHPIRKTDTMDHRSCVRDVFYAIPRLETKRNGVLIDAFDMA